MIKSDVGLFFADGRVESRRLARSRFLEILDRPGAATFADSDPRSPLSTRRFEAADFAMGPRRFWCFIDDRGLRRGVRGNRSRHGRDGGARVRVAC